MLNFLKTLHRDERGVSALEYAILAAVLLAVIVTAVTALGTDISTTFTSVGTKLKALVP